MVLQGCFMFILVTGSYLRNNVQVLLQIPDVHLKMMNHTPGFWTGFFFPSLLRSSPQCGVPWHGHHSNLLNFCTHHGKMSQFVINLSAKKQWEGFGFIFSAFSLIHPKETTTNQVSVSVIASGRVLIELFWVPRPSFSASP